MATKKTAKKTASKAATTKKRPISKTGARTTSGKATKGQTSANVGKKDSKPNNGATNAKKATRGKSAAKPEATKPGKVSLLDAAAQVLAKAKNPMPCKAIVEVILKQGDWKTSGKTPHATLYSSILREIQNKGKDSRFKKVDRGLFTVNTKR